MVNQQFSQSLNRHTDYTQATVTHKELSSTLTAGVGCVLTMVTLLGPATCGVLLVGSLETSGGLECLLVGVASTTHWYTLYKW